MVSIYFEKWNDGKVLPWSGEMVMLAAIPLAKRLPVSSRISSQMIHPDRNEAVSSIEFDSGGSRIIGSNYPRNNIQIWDASTGKQLISIDTQDEYKGSMEFWELGEAGKLYSYVQSRGDFERIREDGKDGVRVEYPDSRVQVWDSNTGKLLDEIRHDPSSQFGMISLSPDKQYLSTLENLSGTFFGDRERAQRTLNLDTGHWTTAESDAYIYCYNKAATRGLKFTPDSSGRYSTAVSIHEFPSLKKIRSFPLPHGIHAGNMAGFSADGRHIWAEYRTYKRKNVWNKWKTTVACFEVETGKRVGQWEYPYENDSPLFADQQLADGTLVCVTWRRDDKQLIGLSLPDLNEKWRADIGEYARVMSPVVSPDRQWLAANCVPDQLDRSSEDTDWDLVPQNDLKIFDTSGKCLETIVLPVGCSTLAFSEDGKQAAIGAVGSVWKVDFSRPFENEQN